MKYHILFFFFRKIEKNVANLSSAAVVIAAFRVDSLIWFYFRSHPAFNKEVFIDFIAAQIKTLSFLAYIVRIYQVRCL